jgi:cytochrome c oxidase subunit 2
MTSIILGIGVVLILVIIMMIFRVQSLISLVRGTPTTRETTSNKVNAAMWVVFLVLGTIGAVWSSIAASDYFLPDASSPHGRETDDLFWITMGITGAVFFATHVLLFYFPWKYRFRENRKASFYPDNNRLEVIWTVVPAIVLTLLVLSGWKVWRDITNPAQTDNGVMVEIVGKQFNWEVRYPGDKHAELGKRRPELGGFDFRLIDASNVVGIDLTDENSFDDFMAREIHLPKGRQVMLKIRARDVLHSVFMPHFRVKMDAVPGMPTKFAFTPDRTTKEMREELGNPEFNYELACTEVCGRGHFSMRTIIVVEEEAEYNAWVAKQKPWLAQNRDYLNKVPANLQEKALRVIGPGDGGAAPEGSAADSTAAAALSAKGSIKVVANPKSSAQ